MLYHRKQVRALLAFPVLIATILSACSDSTTAPDAPLERRAYAQTEKRDCITSEANPYEYGSWQQETCENDGPPPPIEVDMCVDPVTEQQYVCPPPAERRVFSDAGAVSNELSSRVDASTATLAAYEQQQGFQSLRDYLDGGEEFTTGSGEEPTGNEAVALANDGVVRSDFPVGDAILSLMNNRGEIQIGDSVYKVTRDNVFVVHVADVAVLQQKVPTLSSPPPADGDPRIAVSPVESNVAPEYEAATSRTPLSGEARRHHVPGVGGVCHVYAGSDYRMRGKSYKTFWVWYTEAGVTTEWERKKRSWWRGSYWANTSQSGTLGYSFTSTLTQGHILLPGSNPAGPPSGSNSNVGQSRIHKTLAWGFNHRINGEIHTRHTVANSQVTGFCDTTA
jgi:hypothetical protein